MVAVVIASGHVWDTVKRHSDRAKQTTVTTSNTISLELTYAGLHALKPLVINVSVAGTSTVLVPSPTRSATTDSSGFLEGTALWTPHRIGNR